MAPHVQPLANHTHLRRILLYSLPPATKVEWKGNNHDNDDDQLTYGQFGNIFCCFPDVLPKLEVTHVFALYAEISAVEQKYNSQQNAVPNNNI